MNRLIALIGLAVLVAGCSDSALMDDLGERSHGYVVGSTTTTVFVRVGDTVSAASGVGPVEGVRWYNEGIQGEETPRAASSRTVPPRSTSRFPGFSSPPSYRRKPSG